MRGGADISELGAVRSFTYPGGRVWTVCVYEPRDASAAPVLRFTSGTRTLDLASWPADWPDYNEEQLVALLRSAAPRAASWTPGAPKRRWNDPRP
jgi:hypothetical protein